MFEIILICIAAIVLSMVTFIIGAYVVKLWYMVPERKMSKAERKLNKFIEFLIYMDWYPKEE